MAGVNKVILVGHVGRDPEIKATQAGGKIATFSLATSESWKDKATGERKEATEWHQVVVFSEPLVKLVEQYVRKGSKLFVCGALKTRKWQDQSGQDRYRTEIVLQAFRGEIQLLDRAERAPDPDEGSYGAPEGASSSAASSAGTSAGPASRAADLDDDIPF